MKVDYQKVRQEFRNLDAVYDGVEKNDALTKAFNQFRKVAVEFRQKYFLEDDDQQWTGSVTIDLTASRENASMIFFTTAKGIVVF